MYSGNPEPATDLALILQKKRAQPTLNCEVVSDASRWLKSQLVGANIKFTYLSCDSKDFYGYAMFVLQYAHERRQSVLEIKIAEIDNQPHAFCEIKLHGHSAQNIFPLFCEIGSDEGKQHLLAYLADFVLSNEG